MINFCVGLSFLRSLWMNNNNNVDDIIVMIIIIIFYNSNKNIDNIYVYHLQIDRQTERPRERQRQREWFNRLKYLGSICGGLYI